MFGHRAKITDEIFFFAVDKCLSQKQTGAHTQTIIIKKKGNIINKKRPKRRSTSGFPRSLSLTFFSKNNLTPKMVAKKLVRRVFSLSLGDKIREPFFCLRFQSLHPEKKKTEKKKIEDEENVGLLPDRRRNCWKKKSLENGVNLLQPYWLLLSRKLLVD